MLSAPKPRDCKQCGKSFIPFTSMQILCGKQRCGVAYGKVLAANRKRDLRTRKAALRTRADAKRAAQKAFNSFVRQRDKDLPCVSCGVLNPPDLPGGQWDAGHFLSRGAYPELAFNEDNCHKQCKSCNAGSGKFAHKARTVADRYEAELLNRIGADRLAALKGPHGPAKLSQAEYDAIEATYKAKLKALEKA